MAPRLEFGPEPWFGYRKYNGWGYGAQMASTRYFSLSLSTPGERCGRMYSLANRLCRKLARTGLQQK